jgi:hypothetical protein
MRRGMDMRLELASGLVRAPLAACEGGGAGKGGGGGGGG